MVLLAVFAAVAAFVDPREVTGLNVWLKPLKFAISTAVYSVTLSWLIGQLRAARRPRGSRARSRPPALAIELIIITGFAAAGDTSHFNVTTPLHTARLVGHGGVDLGGLGDDAARRDRAVPQPARRPGAHAGDPGRRVIAILGMGLAFLMTGPQGDQISDYQGIVGAHTVGVADGGPGPAPARLEHGRGRPAHPALHRHARLQVLPLFVIALELLARRGAALAGVVVRTRLVAVAAVTYSP